MASGSEAPPTGDALVTAILKDLTKAKAGEFSRFSDKVYTSEPTIWLSTGLTLLDHAIRGGFPVGRVVEIFGHESSGKSLLTLNTLALAQQAGWVCGFVDTERAVHEDFAVRLGRVDPNNLIYDNVRYLEQALDSLSDMITTTRKIAPVKDGGPPLILLLDSLAGLCTKGELASRMEMKEGLARRAYFIKLWFAKEIDRIADENVLLLMTNHTIANIGGSQYQKETTPGGGGPKFYSSIRIRLDIIKTIRKDPWPDPLGIWVKATIKKNRMDPPNKEIEFPIYYTDGINDRESVYQYLADRGVFGKSSGYAVWDGVRAQRSKFLQKMAEDPALWAAIRAKAIDVFNSGMAGTLADVDPDVVSGVTSDAEAGPPTPLR